MNVHQPPALPFPITPRRAGDPQPDLLAYGLIHRALLSGATQLAATFAALDDDASCGPARIHAINVFATNVLDELDVHHDREDSVLWPVIAASAGSHVDLAPLVDDHRTIHAMIEAIRDELARFAEGSAGGASATGATSALAKLFDALAVAVREHVTEEEAAVFPAIRTYVSAADFDRCARSFQKGSSFAHLRFVLPWFADQCTDEEEAQLRASAPIPVRMILRLATPAWRRRRDLVVGAAQR